MLTYSTDRITMKFYQLKTMDFLVKEISLEYEVKLREAKDTVPFHLSSQFKKEKGKTDADTSLFPPAPGQARSQPSHENSPTPENEQNKNSETVDKEGGDEKKEDGKDHAPSPQREKRVSVRLNLCMSHIQHSCYVIY